MVADVHRTLMYGGIYMYPADKAKVKITMKHVFSAVVVILVWFCLFPETTALGLLAFSTFLRGIPQWDSSRHCYSLILLCILHTNYL